MRRRDLFKVIAGGFLFGSQIRPGQFGPATDAVTAPPYGMQTCLGSRDACGDFCTVVGCTKRPSRCHTRLPGQCPDVPDPLWGCGHCPASNGACACLPDCDST